MKVAIMPSTQASSSKPRKRSFSGSTAVNHGSAAGVSTGPNQLEQRPHSEEDISNTSSGDSGCGSSSASSALPTGNKSRKSSGSSSSGCSVKMTPLIDHQISPTGKPPSSIQSRFKHFFMDSFSRPRSNSESESSGYSSASQRQHHRSGGGVSDKAAGLTPLTISTAGGKGGVYGESGTVFGLPVTPCSPLSPSACLESIPQGQELSTNLGRLASVTIGSPSTQGPPSHFQYGTTPPPSSSLGSGQSTPSTPTSKNGGTPVADQSPQQAHNVTPPSSKSLARKLSKSPKTSSAGGLIHRLRSLSMSLTESSSTVSGASSTSEFNPCIDPAKLPREEPRGSILFSPQALKTSSSRPKKLTQPTSSSEFSGDAVRPRSRRLSEGFSASEDALLQNLAFASSRNDLERALSLAPDPDSDAGTALTAMNCGVRRVSENSRLLVLSKSPIPTPNAFLQEGTEVFGDNNAYAIFFQHSTCYDLMPDSAKLIVLDSKLQVGRAFRAMVLNGIRAAPIWNSTTQRHTGMLTVTDFIRVLDIYYDNSDLKIDDFEAQTIDRWRDLTRASQMPLYTLTPEDSLFTAIALLQSNPIHRIPVIDTRSGNVLHTVTPRILLRYLRYRQLDLPRPQCLKMTLAEAFDSWPKRNKKSSLVTVPGSCLVIEALRLLIKKDVACLPVVDEKGKLNGIYAKVEAFNMATNGTYKNLNISVEEALESRDNQFSATNVTCQMSDTLGTIMDKMLSTEDEFLVVVDNDSDLHVINTITITDLLTFIVIEQAPPPPTPVSNHVLTRSKSLDQSGSPPLSQIIASSSSIGLRHAGRRRGPIRFANSFSQFGGGESLPSPSELMETDEDVFKMEVS